MRASIVVRTFNEERYLPSLLAAVDGQTVPPDERELIVVDSGSTDNTRQIATSNRNTRLVSIAREDFSFGRSLNIGCDAARGETLVFISGHCVPTSTEWLSTLIEPIESGRATITYGRQQGGAETRFSEHQIFAKNFPATGTNGHTAFFCNNANAAVKRSAWAQNRFDEALTGLEDLHLAKRLVESGHRVEYIAAASVFHYHHESGRQVIRRFEREALALQSIMPEIHIGIGVALRYFSAAVISDWTTALQQGRLAKSVLEIAKYRFCQYYGSWRGNHSHRKMSRESRERYFFPQ